MSAFSDAVDLHFPGAMPSADYLAQVRRRLEPLGFTRERTLPLVSICRDELTSGFVDQIAADWGAPFSLAGLGGLPTFGRSGWGAALNHVPDDARGCVLVFGFSHIGITRDGSVGFVLRPGQSAPTETCGALSSIHHRWHAGGLAREIDIDDFEATRLALRLVELQREPTTLVDLTITAADAIASEVWKALGRPAVTDRHDVVVWCGVQIHGLGHDDWIWPQGVWHRGIDGQPRRPPDPLTAPGG